MPYINIKIVKDSLTEEQKSQLISGITDLVVTIMSRSRVLTVITIDEIHCENWAIGGIPSKLRKNSNFLIYTNIKVSKGTTNGDEASKMIKASKKLYSQITGSFEITNYFVIEELNSELWGFDELTMKERAILSK